MMNGKAAKGDMAIGFVLLFLAGLTVFSGQIDGQPAPPQAPQRFWRDSIHGHVRSDEFHWMRERNDPELMAYLAAENAYAESILRHTRKLQEKLYREMRSRIREADLSVPVMIDSFYYYSRTVKARDYPIYCRRKGNLKAKEEVLLDENRLAGGRAYYSIDGTYISPDHATLAYMADTSGAFLYTIYLKDIASGRLVDSISSARGMAWSTDSRTVFYEACDSAQRTDRVIRRQLGSGPEKDEIVYRESDPEFSVSVSLTRSRGFLLIHTYSKNESEALVCPADSPNGCFRILKARSAGAEYYVDHHGDSLYVITNDVHDNFRMVSVSTANRSDGGWNEVIPGRDDVLLEDVRIYNGHYVLVERRDGLKRLRVLSWDGAVDRYIPFPEPTYTVFPWRSYDYNSSVLRYTYGSMVTPGSVYEHDMSADSYRLLKRYGVKGGYRPSRYVSERVSAVAADGQRVPISLVYRRGLRRDNGNPCLLSGYGAYGTSSDPFFSSDRLSLLDRGFVWAVAHVRGGQEMGRKWYQQGRLMNKKNTFSDFIACAEHLISQGYASPSELAVSGGSAGGLLVGAVVNQRPDLFRAAVLNVPFVDVINTMLDPAIPLTTIEYQEWGDPRVKEHYDYMSSYAPYENIRAQDYPAMLVTGGLNDTNVPYWEPAKWTARLRRTKTDANTLIMKIDLSSGHGGPSGRFSYLRDTALEYAFLLDAMDIGK